MGTLQSGAGLGRRPQPSFPAGAGKYIRRARTATSLLSLLATLNATTALAAPSVVRQMEPHPKADDFDFSALRAPGAAVWVDTLPVRCPRASGSPVSARFALTLRVAARDAREKPGAGSPPALRIGFWERGVEHFSLRVGPGREAVGAVTTLSFDLAALPPVGGAVLRNTGHGLRLLQGGGLSYSVSDRTAVLQAQLSFRCGQDAFSFATVEPTSVIGDYRPADAWRSVPPMTVLPRIPQRRDAAPGRFPGDTAFE